MEEKLCARFSTEVVKSARVLLVLASGLFQPWTLAQDLSADLASKSIEELMNVQVTTVSKKEETLFQTAAAIYVITQEDIRRSGLTSIPEILRLAPGVSVARIDGNKWAIAARGFSGRFATKLLVMIDGRSIYTQLFSGVYWEAHDLLLENIERIEVIRGPGGSIWGANAVNGVINIITKRAEQTQGGLLSQGVGWREGSFGGARFGGKIGNSAYYRFSAKYFDRSTLVNFQGAEARDGQKAVNGGGRIDWEISARDSLSIQGDIFDTTLRETSIAVSLADPFKPPTNTPGEFNGGNALARLSHTFSDKSQIKVQAYYDRFRRESFDQGERTDTFDVDLQHNFSAGRRTAMVWGLSYRLISNQTAANFAKPVRFFPAGRSLQLFSGFSQSEYTLVKDRLRLIVGAKLEHNDYSGFEFQPTGRFLWTPRGHQTVWGAVSRAVRTPSRFERGFRVNFPAIRGEDGLTIIPSFIASSDFRSEEMRSYELGYRAQPSGRFSLDLAAFYNTYDRLYATKPGAPFFEVEPPPGHLTIPIGFGNQMKGETYGAEVAANFDLTGFWKAQGSYSFLRMQLHRAPDIVDSQAEAIEGHTPRHQFQLHSFLTLRRNVEWSVSLFRSSKLVGNPVPGYTRLDSGLGWQATERLVLRVQLQNLADDRRPEFNAYDISVVPSQVRRAIYGRATWRF